MFNPRGSFSTVAMPKENAKPTKLLKIEEAAKRLSVSRSTMYQLVEKRQLPHHRIGLGRGAIRISEVDLVEFLRQRRIEQLGANKNDKRPRPTRKRLRHLRE